MKYPRSAAPLTLVLLQSTVLVACDRDRAPEPSAAVPEPVAPTSTEAPTLPPDHPPVAQPAAAPKASGLSWTDPEGWTRAPQGSAMRLATYTIPKAEGDPEDAELAVFYFGPGAAGGIEANVDRWLGQFQGVDKSSVKRDQRNVAGMPQHIVEIESGTFASGMPRGPKTPRESYGLLAAIVEAPTGAHFFKMTGPEKTVAAARGTFLKMLETVRVGDKSP